MIARFSVTVTLRTTRRCAEGTLKIPKGLGFAIRQVAIAQVTMLQLEGAAAVAVVGSNVAMTIKNTPPQNLFCVFGLRKVRGGNSKPKGWGRTR